MTLQAEEAVVVRPGDTLILRVRTDTTASQARRFRDQLEAQLPEDVDVQIIGCEQMAVYRPGEMKEA